MGTCAVMVNRITCNVFFDGAITCKITGLLCHICIHVMEVMGLHDTFTVVNTVHLELVLMEAVCTRV